MKVTNEKTENRQVFLTVEMEPAEIEGSLEEAYHRLVKKTDVPGFRRGKAPRVTLENYIGRESLLKDALNSLIPEACENAIKEQGIEAFARPSVEVTRTDPLAFKAVIPLPPVITLGDYHQIRMTPEPMEIGEDNVNTVIERIRHEQATWEPVERPVEANDMVILNIESTADGKPLINREGVQYQVLENQPLPMPGFAEQISGMVRDEEKEFRLQIPKDFPKSELVDKEALFKVRVGEVKQEKLPELNDEFAGGVDQGFETLEKLNEHILDGLRQAAEEKARSDLEGRVIEAAVDQAEVEFPPFLVEMEIDQLLEQQLRRWQASGRDLDEYMAAIKKTEQKLREDLSPPATKRVIRSLVLGKISQEEEIKIDDSEVTAEIEDMIKNATPERKDELRTFLSTPRSRGSIVDVLMGRKTVQRLVEIAGGPEVDSEVNTEREKKEGQQ